MPLFQELPFLPLQECPLSQLSWKRIQGCLGKGHSLLNQTRSWPFLSYAENAKPSSCIWTPHWEEPTWPLRNILVLFLLPLKILISSIHLYSPIPFVHSYFFTTSVFPCKIPRQLNKAQSLTLKNLQVSWQGLVILCTYITSSTPVWIWICTINMFQKCFVDLWGREAVLPMLIT